MTFNSVNRKGKNPREKRSINIALRRRFWAGVKVGTASAVAFETESARNDGSDMIGGGGAPEPARIDGLWTMILCRGTHGVFESTLSVRTRLKLWKRVEFF